LWEGFDEFCLSASRCCLEKEEERSPLYICFVGDGRVLSLLCFVAEIYPLLISHHIVLGRLQPQVKRSTNSNSNRKAKAQKECRANVCHVVVFFFRYVSSLVSCVCTTPLLIPSALSSTYPPHSCESFRLFLPYPTVPPRRVKAKSGRESKRVRKESKKRGTSESGFRMN